jgi:hypothetical protein
MRVVETFFGKVGMKNNSRVSSKKNTHRISYHVLKLSFSSGFFVTLFFFSYCDINCTSANFCGVFRLCQISSRIKI